MIPDKRVKKALLRVEIRQILEELGQTNAAILHLLSGGEHNYNTAKSKFGKTEEYKNSSDEILLNLESRRHEKENRLRLLSDELASLGDGNEE